MRIDSGGQVSARASAHGHWQPWRHATGWTRVSRGSHAGHVPELIPGHGRHERSSTAEGLGLGPLETLDQGDYEPLDPKISPPWQKPAWDDPGGDRS